MTNSYGALRGVEDRPLFVTIPGDFRVSFEFFPPKTETMERQLTEAREQLERIRPQTFGQAGRVRGITPADLTLVLVHLEGRA